MLKITSFQVTSIAESSPSTPSTISSNIPSSVSADGRTIGGGQLSGLGDTRDLGAFLGGLAGAAVGSGVVPVIGTVVGSFIGAFAGAVAGEYLREQKSEESMRVGWHAFAGKMLASGFKFALALAMIVMLVLRVWPGGA